MLTIIKETPITFNGVDVMETLVSNDSMAIGCACSYCMYLDYVPPLDLLALCSDVHGCGHRSDTYFIARDL